MCGTVCRHDTLPPTLEFPTRRPRHKYSSQIHSALHTNTILDISRCSTACQITVSHIRPNLAGKCLERRPESSVTTVTWLKLHGQGTGVRFQEGTRVFFFTKFWTTLVLTNLIIQRLSGALTPIIKNPQVDIF